MNVELVSTIRHIYNNSTCAWTVNAGTMTSGMPQIGNVWFAGGPENGPMIIPAGQVVETTYTNTNGGNQGAFNITDGNGLTKSFDYINAYINHDGNTGGCWFNDAADGDINMGSCGW